MPSMTRLMPAELYAQAEKEHPHDREALRDRYRQLMIEHGHLVERQPGDDGSLPCGVILGTLAGVAKAKAMRRRR
jgi:hypothetical protein